MKPTVVDIFCGAGGISEGFRQAGCEIIAAADIDPWATQTFANAHPSTLVLNQPIEKINWKSFSRNKLKNRDLDFLVGGPPCQSYSLNNHQRGLHDKRSKLFRSYLKAVSCLKPKWIVLENVTGIFSAGDGKVVDRIKNGLEKLGYNVEYKTLNCSHYGIPQARIRVLFVGNRTGQKIIWPNPRTSRKKNQMVTVEEAIGDLPSILNGGGKEFAEYIRAPFSRFQRLARKNSKQLFNHIAPNLSRINLKRIKCIPQGGNWRNIPRRLLPPGMRRAKKKDHTKRYGRLLPAGIASTILTKCDIHWGAYIHPTDDRSLSVREAARIQSFPDTYKFFGSKSSQYIQVGNAVPPLLAKVVAKSILSTYFT